MRTSIWFIAMGITGIMVDLRGEEAEPMSFIILVALALALISCVKQDYKEFFKK